MLRRRPARARALGDRLESHELHQALHPLAIDHVALLAQPGCYPPRAIKGRPQVLPVDERHQLKLVGAELDRPVVKCRAAQPQKLALAAERKWPMSFDHRQTPLAR